MKITADNYEQWALDYLEGSLAPSDQEAFERFLVSDAQAARQIRSLQTFLPVARPEEISYPRSAELLRIRISPWRRLASFVSGAAAAAAIMGSIMLLDSRSESVQMADSRNFHVQPASNARVAEVLPGSTDSGFWTGESASSTPGENFQGNESTNGESAGISSSAIGSVSSGPKSREETSSRLAAWNRKTTVWLERMENRNNRRSVNASEFEAAEIAPQKGSTVESADHLAGLSGFGTDNVDDRLSASRDEGLSVAHVAEERIVEYSTPLPPDATTPILTLSEEAFSGEGFEAFEKTMSTDDAYWASESEFASDELSGSRPERNLLRALLSPLEKISPIRYYETENARGIEIASILRIGSRNREP